MAKDEPIDYYAVLQVSENAESETISRVYRLLARRYHPDNQDSGNDNRFREITEAYNVLSDPEKRARYDVLAHQSRKDRWRLVSAGAKTENDFEMEQIIRLTILEVLYTKRRIEPSSAGIFFRDFEQMIGRPREHLEFTFWFLQQKKYVSVDDHSCLAITVEGVEYLESSYNNKLQRKRLEA